MGWSSSKTNRPEDKASATFAPFSVTAVFAQITVNVRKRRYSPELEALPSSPPQPPPLPQPVATSPNSSANEPTGACPRSASVFAAADAVSQLVRSSICSAATTTPREAGCPWSKLSVSADENPRERVLANRRRQMSQNQLRVVNGSTQEWCGLKGVQSGDRFCRYAECLVSIPRGLLHLVVVSMVLQNIMPLRRITGRVCLHALYFSVRLGYDLSLIHI